MNELQKRALLYGGAVFVLSGIAVAWANRSADADVLTLLSSAHVQLGMAYAIPATDQQGHRLDSRGTLIDSAEESLATVERLQPGMAVTAEFRGFAHMLRGQHAEAAQCYRAARQCVDFDRSQHAVLAFNEARMLAAAGSRQAALDVFAANRQRIDEQYRNERLLEEAAILRALGRRLEAEQNLDIVARDRSAPAMARVEAGREYLALGHLDKAEAALNGAREEVPIADYHLAKLKLQQGAVDSCCELLNRAAKARPAEVRRMLRKEADAWSAVATDARFQQLTTPPPATPGR